MFIGEIILQRRKELKMTQKQLAEKLNVTDRTISILFFFVILFHL